MIFWAGGNRDLFLPCFQYPYGKDVKAKRMLHVGFALTATSQFTVEQNIFIIVVQCKKYAQLKFEMYNDSSTYSVKLVAYGESGLFM